MTGAFCFPGWRVCHPACPASREARHTGSETKDLLLPTGSTKYRLQRTKVKKNMSLREARWRDEAISDTQCLPGSSYERAFHGPPFLAKRDTRGVKRRICFCGLASLRFFRVLFSIFHFRFSDISDFGICPHSFCLGRGTLPLHNHFGRFGFLLQLQLSGGFSLDFGLRGE